MTLAPRFTSKKLSLCALATALLWWLSLQQTGLFALGWIALMPFLWACGELVSTSSRFFYGWRTGFLCFLLHNWWLLPTITKGSVMIGVPSTGGALLGVLAVGLIALGHGLGLALVASAWNPKARFFQTSPLLLPVAAALLWMAFDWARCQGDLAHSWGALAYSQWSDVPLLQSAFLIGQHGLSALCIWFAASLALWLRPEYSARFPNLWRLPIAVFALLHLWGAWRILDYDSLSHETMSVLLVQTNASSLTKAGSESQFEQAERLTLENLWGVTDLIVWPETSAELTQTVSSGTTSENTFAFTRARHELRAASLAQIQATPLLLGAQVNGVSEDDTPAQLAAITNRAVLFLPDGTVQSRAKTHVVPFGERAPFSSALPFLNQLAPEPPVVPENFIEPLEIKSKDRAISIGTAICFESCFISPSRPLRKQGARALFVLTNDEWFSGTNAPWEHAAMSAVRAAENGIAVAQSANGGYSFIIDGRGRFLARSEFGVAQIVRGEVPLTP